MGILDRAIKRGVNRAVNTTVSSAVSNAVERTVNKAVAPRVNAAAESVADSAAKSIDRTVGPVPQPTSDAAATASGEQLGGAFSGLAGVMTGFANEAAKNMKICPSCGEGASADTAFCPNCGAKLPEMTVAQGALCPACGKQNNPGTKFCGGCGAKLPGALAEEQAAQDKSAAVMARWEQLLAHYPKWNGGGRELTLEPEDGYIRFCADFERGFNAENEMRQYRQLLMQNGFHQAGQYPDVCHLYSKIDGVCYHVDTEHCFEGGTDHVDVYFSVEEPTGGYDYVKPEPKKSSSIFDIFK